MSYKTINWVKHLSWQHTHELIAVQCRTLRHRWQPRCDPSRLRRHFSVHQLFRQKRYKVYMVFAFHRFMFSSLSTGQNKRWLLSWGEAGLEPAELGTGPPRPADGHRSPCSALSQSWCGWVTADLHLARPEGNTTHLPYGNLSGIFQFCIRPLNGPCECPFCKAEERLDVYHLKSQSFLKWALAFLKFT